MSWSIRFVGKPDAIVRALNQHKEKLSGASLIEFTDVLPSLFNLVRQNYERRPGRKEQVLRLVAFGSGITETKDQHSERESVERNVSVTLETLGEPVE